MDFSLSGLLEQRIGNWEVVSFSVTELEAYKYNLDVKTSRQIKAGDYKALY